MTLAAGMWWHQTLVAFSRLLVLQELSTAAQQWLWHGKLEVWVFCCNSDHFGDQLSSLAGEKCQGTRNRNTGASRKETSWTAFPSREIYHVTTSWALTSSAGGFFPLPYSHLLLVQPVWMPSRNHGHYSDLLWNLIPMTPKPPGWGKSSGPLWAVLESHPLPPCFFQLPCLGSRDSAIALGWHHRKMNLVGGTGVCFQSIHLVSGCIMVQFMQGNWQKSSSRPRGKEKDTAVLSTAVSNLVRLSTSANRRP